MRLGDSQNHCAEHWDCNSLPVEKPSLNMVPYCDACEGRVDRRWGPADLMSSFTVLATAADPGQAVGPVAEGRCRLVLSTAQEIDAEQPALP